MRGMSTNRGKRTSSFPLEEMVARRANTTRVSLPERLSLQMIHTASTNGTERGVSEIQVLISVNLDRRLLDADVEKL